MSGGSHNYICFRIEEDLCGQMYDEELNDLVKDIANLAHDLEWADSGDTSHEEYNKSVVEFKEKWFKSSREERLRSYVDSKCGLLKAELYKLIGIED